MSNKNQDCVPEVVKDQRTYSRDVLVRDYRTSMYAVLQDCVTGLAPLVLYGTV